MTDETCKFCGRSVGADEACDICERVVQARNEAQKWRNDAFEAAAHIAERWGAHEAAIDIRALIRR